MQGTLVASATPAHVRAISLTDDERWAELPATFRREPFSSPQRTRGRSTATDERSPYGGRSTSTLTASPLRNQRFSAGAPVALHGRKEVFHGDA